MSKKLYAALCASKASDGLYRYWCDGASLTLLDKTFAPEPLYTSVGGGFIYCIMTHPNTGERDMNSYIGRFKINADGSFEENEKFISTSGIECCHVSQTADKLFLANYGSGSAAMLDKRAFDDGGAAKVSVHSGHGTDMSRQDNPHVHQMYVTPDGKYVCAVDLGTDSVVVYDTDLNEVSRVKLHDGCGPRHIVFTPKAECAYCLTEMGSTVERLEYADGRFIHTASYTTLPSDYKGHNQSAAIRISGDGKHLYASNRGHNSIAHFVLDDGGASLSGITPTGGDWPRDITLTPDGKFIFACNERSDTVTVLSVNADGSLKYIGVAATAPGPLALEFYTA